MEIKSGVFDRLGISFKIFIQNFASFFMPMFVYNLLSVVLFGSVFSYFIFSNIGDFNSSSLGIFEIFNNTTFVILIILGVLLFLLYLVLYIAIFLGLIKSVKDSVEGNEINTKSNLSYGFSNILKSFKTYWYIFVYVALIPSIIFIIGGLILNINFFLGGPDILKKLGFILMILGGVLFIFFALYRGIKATFALYSAVDFNKFSKDNFDSSIFITNNNWWRIVGNFLLLGIITFIFTKLILLFTSFLSYSGIDYNSIESIDDLFYIAQNFSFSDQVISSFINNIVNTFFSVFVIVFTYVFYLALSKDNINRNIDNGDIKL